MATSSHHISMRVTGHRSLSSLQCLKRGFHLLQFHLPVGQAPYEIQFAF